MTQQALIVVDMLNDFIDEKGALYCGKSARKIVPHIRDLIAGFREKGDAVIYLADAHDKDDREFQRFPPHCVAGTWGSRIIAELAPKDRERIIPKRRYSGFYDTELDALLAKIAPESVTVVGVCTSICIMDTVGGLANRDYAIRVPQKGVADFDPEMHQFALRRMQQLYGAKLA